MKARFFLCRGLWRVRPAFCFLFSAWLCALTPSAVTRASGAELITFSYDTAGRLVGANHGFGRTASFTYDATGNLLRSANAIIPDSDNDGMEDSWEQTYLLTVDRDGTGDFDNDGFSDLSEFLAGTLPNDPNSLLKLTRIVTATGISVTIEWLSVAGKKYRVQYTNSLSDAGWNDLPGDVTAAGAAATKADDTAPGQGDRFYRVQVVQ